MTGGFPSPHAPARRQAVSTLWFVVCRGSAPPHDAFPCRPPQLMPVRMDLCTRGLISRSESVQSDISTPSPRQWRSQMASENGNTLTRMCVASEALRRSVSLMCQQSAATGERAALQYNGVQPSHPQTRSIRRRVIHGSYGDDSQQTPVGAFVDENVSSPRSRWRCHCHFPDVSQTQATPW